ncbi:MAG: TlpA disulfide reductase family protein [Bacteroidota bacterium]
MMRLVIFFVLVMVCMSCDTLENPPEVAWQTLSLQTLEGKPVSTDGLTGTPILLNFWATWCKPCLEELPAMEKLMKTDAGKHVNFILVSEESLPTLQEFTQKNPYSFTFLQSKTSLQELGLILLPQSYLLDADGKVIWQEGGTINWDKKEHRERLKGLTLMN